MNRGVNLPAVVTAALVNFFLQAAWFTAFKVPWIAGVGKTEAELLKSASAAPYIEAFVCNLLIAYVLAWVVQKTGEQTAGRGIKIGMFMWLGFVGTTMLTELAFEARGLMFFGVVAGSPLFGMIFSGAIVGGWKKK